MVTDIRVISILHAALKSKWMLDKIQYIRDGDGEIMLLRAFHDFFFVRENWKIKNAVSATWQVVFIY